MGVAEFIKNRFLNSELCIFVGEDAEILTYQEAWASNKAYFRGTIVEVSENVVVVEIPDNGIIYINADEINSFWEPEFDYHKAIRTSLTKKMVGARRKYHT